MVCVCWLRLCSAWMKSNYFMSMWWARQSRQTHNFNSKCLWSVHFHAILFPSHDIEFEVVMLQRDCFFNPIGTALLSSSLGKCKSMNKAFSACTVSFFQMHCKSPLLWEASKDGKKRAGNQERSKRSHKQAMWTYRVVFTVPPYMCSRKCVNLREGLKKGIFRT